MKDLIFGFCFKITKAKYFEKKLEKLFESDDEDTMMVAGMMLAHGRDVTGELSDKEKVDRA